MPRWFHPVACSSFPRSSRQAKYLGDEVELEWSTEDESENIGFSVQKRRSGSQAWETVRSHTDYAPLKSQGSDGGTYTYLDDECSEGEWIYRILADEADGRKSSVCQVGVTIQSASEQLQARPSSIKLPRFPC